MTRLAAPPFRVKGKETMAAGIRRLAEEQIELARLRLRAAREDDFAEAVHEARKALKRVRAALKLARPELGDEVYRLENAALRDAGRKLARARDAAVFVTTLDSLPTDGDDGHQPFGGLRRKLVDERAQAESRLRGSPAIEEVLETLDAAATRAAAWPLGESAGHDGLARGVKRARRRVRRAARAARRPDSDDEALHELRKRVKDLWHAAEAARPVAPKAMRRLARDAHDVADLLGEDHDLAQLAALAQHRTGVLEPGEHQLLDRLVSRRRKELRRAIRRSAKRLHSRSISQLA